MKDFCHFRTMSNTRDACSVCGPPDLQAQLLTALKDKNIILFSRLLQKYTANDKKFVNPDHEYGDPHFATCLFLACKEHDSKDFIEALLNAGADPNRMNPIRKKAPLHVATEHGNYTAIDVLLQDSRMDVNIQDDFGCTALHLAAKHFMKNQDDMESCIAALTQANIKINMRNRKGRTAVHEAVLGNCEHAVKTILRYGKSNVDIENRDTQNGRTIRELIQEKFPNLDLPPPKAQGLSGEEVTTLFEHLYFKQYDDFRSKFQTVDKKLLDAHHGKFSFLQYACHYGLCDITNYLLSNGANPDITAPTNTKPPIFLACSGGYYDILWLLLEYKAKVAAVDGYTPLHAVIKDKELKVAAGRDYRKCFELLLERKESLKLDINATDINGNTALHYAVKEEDQHYTKALLKNGAYIGLQNHFGYSPLADIDPVTLQSFLDDCLASNGKFRRDDKYELTFKYRFLEPPASEKNVQDFLSQESGQLGRPSTNSHKPLPELYPLHYISKSQDLRPFLTHPVLLSFLHLKWKHIRIFFYTNLIFYATFVGLLTFHILSDCSAQNGNISSPEITIQTKTKFIGINWVLLSILLTGLMLRELFQIIMSPKRYFCGFQNCIELLLIVFTIVILSKEWGERCVRPVDTIAILLAWTELFLHIGHIHVLSTYNEMMRRVLCNYLKFLVWDILLIIAFGLGFYTLFHDSITSRKNDGEDNFFQHPFMSLFRTLIMLMGEFDISSVPFDLVPGLSYVIFIFFVFLVPLVMVNLLHGLAVSDTQAIENDAQLVSIESLIDTIFYFETMLLGDPLSCTCPVAAKYQCCCWPNYIHPKLRCIQNLFKNVFLFPNSLPNGQLKIFPNLSHRIVIFPNTVYPEKTPDCDTALEMDCFGLPGGCCKMDRSVLKSAMDIIEKKTEVSDRYLTDRLDSIQQQLQALQKSVDGWFNHKNDK